MSAGEIRQGRCHEGQAGSVFISGSLLWLLCLRLSPRMLEVSSKWLGEAGRESEQTALHISRLIPHLSHNISLPSS